MFILSAMNHDSSHTEETDCIFLNEPALQLFLINRSNQKWISFR